MSYMNGEMLNEVPLIEPNRMSEIYRNFQPASVPLQIDKHLNFIDIAEDGNMLLGSSSLNGRFWISSVHYFNEPSTMENESPILTGINCRSVATDGKFINSKEKVVIGEDSGCISLLALADIEDEGVKSTHVVVRVSTYDHDGGVTSLSVSPNKNILVSGSMDKCIKVWDTHGLVTQYTFRPAHAHIVTSVQYSPSDNSIFASCSLDGYALMWDTRQEKSATEIRKSDGEGLTSVAWDPLNENVLAIGSNYGKISLYDIRSFSAIASDASFNRPVHKLLFNCNGLLAACGDSSVIKVLECDNDTFNTKYSDDRHSYFIRGLSWNPLQNNNLYSCGWDGQILCHNLEKIKNNAG